MSGPKPKPPRVRPCAGGRKPRNGATNLREFVRYYPEGDTTSHELVAGHVVRVGADGWKVRADGTIRNLSRNAWMAVTR